MAGDISKGEQLRVALSKHRGCKRYGKYPDDLRKRAIAYSVERRRAGASVAEIAAELGVQDSTAGAWSSSAIERRSVPSSMGRDNATALSLVPVVVRPESASTLRHTRLEVEFPDGTRLTASGLGGRDFVEAIESLRRVR
jgi:transposase-like protein